MATILCIEDDLLALSALAETLVSLGHRALLATNLEAGFAALDEQPVDLVITDCRLPSATGFDLLDVLGRREPRVPVILVTGFSSLENAIAAMQRGAVDYLVKPLSRERVLAAVGEALRGGGSLGAPDAGANGAHRPNGRDRLHPGG
jgi:DNA-binding NtrC family response regulator